MSIAISGRSGVVVDELVEDVEVVVVSVIPSV